MPQVLSSSRSGHLCSWHFAADGVVVVVRGTTVPKGVVVFTLESLVVVDVVVLVTSVSLSANVAVASNIVVRLDVLVTIYLQVHTAISTLLNNSYYVLTT